MVAEPIDSPDRHYTPDRIDALLPLYPYLVEMRRPRDPQMPMQTVRQSSDGFRERMMATRGDVKMAFDWLMLRYPTEAWAVWWYRCEFRAVDWIATEQGVTERAVYGRVRRGSRRMAERLGWREPLRNATE